MHSGPVPKGTQLPAVPPSGPVAGVSAGATSCKVLVACQGSWPSLLPVVAQGLGVSCPAQTLLQSSTAQTVPSPVSSAASNATPMLLLPQLSGSFGDSSETPLLPTSHQVLSQAGLIALLAAGLWRTNRAGRRAWGFLVGVKEEGEMMQIHFD